MTRKYLTHFSELTKEQQFLSKVKKLAQKEGIENYFMITDGASITKNNGNDAVRNARMKQIAWEKRNGFNPNHDWATK